jgi:iron(III) transport system substrate-binding protein
MAALLVFGAVMALGACTQEVVRTVEVPKPAGSLTVYSGRSQSLVDPIIQQFSQATGVKVQVKYAGTALLAATLLEEGAKSPADVFYAQDPGGLGAVEQLLAPLPESILGRAPPWARSSEGRWVGVSGRARVVVYNTNRLKESDLPDDIYDFVDPKWKGRIGWPVTNASFQTMVTGMRVLWGEEKTRQWLRGIQVNQPRVYPDNAPTVAAVGAGEIEVGFTNHYYLYRFLTQQGEAFPARNYHPRSGGPGALIMVSGAGVLATSKNKEAAEKFLEFMLSPVAQQYFASQTFEYPLVEGVATQRGLVPIAQVKNPAVALKDLADLQGTQRLLRESGALP